MWATNKKNIFLCFFFCFFFCKSFVVSEKWPVQATFIAAWISHFPSNYVYLIREKESQHHLVVIIERNVVVVLYLYCLGEQMKGKEVATELTAWASLITFQELTLKSQKKGENQKFFFDCQFEKVSRPIALAKGLLLGYALWMCSSDNAFYHSTALGTNNARIEQSSRTVGYFELWKNLFNRSATRAAPLYLLCFSRLVRDAGEI